MLLDTSGLLACFDRSETLHQEAIRHYRNAPLRLSHNYVLAEFVPLCQTRGLNRSDALGFARAMLNNAKISFAWVDESLHREAMDLLRARPDKAYSLCDAVSFVLMRQRGLTEALTTDRHFEQEGFVRLLNH